MRKSRTNNDNKQTHLSPKQQDKNNYYEKNNKQQCRDKRGLLIWHYWDLEIKILQEAPRDPEKLREILKVKQEEYEKQTIVKT